MLGLGTHNYRVECNETYLVGSYSWVLCIIIAAILSSSDPFMRDRSKLTLSDSGMGWWLAVGSGGAQDFLNCCANGMRAIINEVFFGIRHASSAYSTKEIGALVELSLFRVLNDRLRLEIETGLIDQILFPWKFSISGTLTFFCLCICNLQIKVARLSQSLLMDDSLQ